MKALSDKTIETGKEIVHILFAVATVILLISGFGILYYKIVEMLTFGLLSKSLSFQIHYYLSFLLS